MLIVGLTTALCIWDVRQWPAMLVITSTHFVIDAIKLVLNKKVNEIRFPRKDIWLFTMDQLLHVLVIFFTWLSIIHGYPRMLALLETVLPDYPFLLRILGYLVLVGPVTYMIRFLTAKWADYLDTREGLQDAGKWIGILERILILTLVYIQQYTAIGFLVAAKSILRLIDKPDPPVPSAGGLPVPAFNARKHTEYVLIGTFLSFGFAIVTGLVINWLLNR